MSLAEPGPMFLEELSLISEVEELDTSISVVKSHLVYEVKQHYTLIFLIKLNSIFEAMRFMPSYL